jgi:hypothetical protein
VEHGDYFGIGWKFAAFCLLEIVATHVSSLLSTKRLIGSCRSQSATEFFLTQFRQQIKATQSKAWPKVLQIYTAVIFPSLVKIRLMGTDGSVKSYYYLELVRRNDGRFEISKPRRVD